MVSQPDERYYSSNLAVRGASSALGVSTSGSGHGHGHSHNHGHSSSAPLPPPAASVAGGGGGHAPSSRSRRYNRSHVGSSSTSAFGPLNEFPVFTSTGDVEIVVRVGTGHENRYLLHRDTLVRCSGFFEASTSKEWSRAQVVKAEGDHPGQTSSRALTSGGEITRVGESGGRTGSRSGSERDVQIVAPGEVSRQGQEQLRRRWRYELDMGRDENDKPILVQRDEDSSRTVASNTAASQSIFGGASGGNSSASAHRMSSSGGASRGGAPTHSNPSFFRSVANLALSHGSRHNHPGSSYSGQRAYSGHGLGNPLYNAPASHLPAPTPDEIDILRDYDNLFRIMYNYPPLLDGVNIADAYVQCKSLLAVADQYDALAFVAPRVDHHLLQFQSRLWRQIAKYPISYLRLGYLARSRVIFQEALVHVVGQWPSGERSLRSAMPDSVMDLIEDKVDELAEAVSRVETRLFRLHLTTRGGERVTPSTSYLDWLAVSLFRQWLADNTAPATGMVSEDPKLMIANRRGAANLGTNGNSHRSGAPRGHHSSGDRASSSSSSSSGSGRHSRGGAALTLHSMRTALVPAYTPALASLGRAYRILGTASSSTYLGHDECKRFLKLSPDLYTRDNLRRFEKRIEELKSMARDIVRPLMGSGLELDVAGGKSSHSHSHGSGSGGGSGSGSSSSPPHEGITYFTCTYISDRDLPWLVDM
ncbi:hypothetical protein F503_06447 [Ophiostoma piceae UAMH 11346]|uniref:BTB domain-containing protein n=1 Tax=Ophiostoma piceae (strain UAMH 11346) TaxID=1262450 RepID=S3BWH5_OPHP1|nr:hypothetical protein F503_06447 [Ophiostoma piceae UAMH 11346]